MQCCYCGTEFPDPVWPNTQGKACSIKCMKRASANRRRAFTAVRQKQYRQDHPERALATKRKYNNSEKGRLAQKRYQQTHDQVSRYLERYRSDPHIREIQQSRAKSRKLLRKIRPIRCEACGLEAPARRIHCHHKDDNPLNRDIANLQWLCITCHNDAHSEFVFRK